MNRDIDETRSADYVFAEDAAPPTRQECVPPKKMNFSITPSRQRQEIAKKKEASPRGIH